MLSYFYKTYYMPRSSYRLICDKVTLHLYAHKRTGAVSWTTQNIQISRYLRTYMSYEPNLKPPIWSYPSSLEDKFEGLRGVHTQR